MGANGRSAVDNSTAAAAAYAAASTPEAVPCGRYLQSWTKIEDDFEKADRDEKLETLGMIRAICGPCPALEECAIWAIEDKYTGFAAGNWYYSGVKRRRASAPSRHRARTGLGGSRVRV